MIKLKRAYDRASRDDGVRYLVERLWPRGIKKTELPLDGWLKESRPLELSLSLGCRLATGG